MAKQADAVLKSGHSIPWFRARFLRREAEGYARGKNGHWQYRDMIVPVGRDPGRLESVRQDAKRAAFGAIRGPNEQLERDAPKGRK